MKIKRNIPMSQFANDAKELVIENWKEMEDNKKNVEFAPDWEKMTILQEMGMLSNVVVYEEERVVGYALILHSSHLHYKYDLFSVVSALYLKPEKRKGITGLNLLKNIEEEAKEKNASVLMYHAKPYSVLEEVLLRKGFRMEETAFIKVLKE